MKKFRTNLTKKEVTIKISVDELLTLHRLLYETKPKREEEKIFIEEFKKHFIND